MAAYSRDMERDADRGGQLLAAAAGYDPRGMSTFLANLALAILGHFAARIPDWASRPVVDLVGGPVAF